MQPEIRAQVESVLGASIQNLKPVSGGDINEAYKVDLSDKRSVFVKANTKADPEMFAAEAHGLKWLAEGGLSLRVPEVIAVAPQFIVLEYLQPGSPWTGFDESLGRGLAELHKNGPKKFGLERNNFIGRLPQPNEPLPTWAEFYRERRLRPMTERAAREGLLPSSIVQKLERLFGKIEQLVGLPEPPARLHGDLWGGNLYVDRRGGPCLVDPAAYGGHREIDLAMMKLFGGFSIMTYGAYQEVYPLEPQHHERVPLYQLYPLLVHVNLFGGSYVQGVDTAVSRYL